MTARRAQLSPVRRWTIALIPVAAMAILGVSCSSTTNNAGPSVGSSTSVTPTVPATTAPSTSVSPSSTSTSTASPSSPVTTALTASYQAETGTLATYRNVVASLGSVGPFPNIVNAEQQHVATVTTLLSRYGVAVPAAATGQASPSTLSAACSLGAALEQQIIGMYADQLPKVSSYADITTAFQNLQSVARDNHLPAFQRC